MTTKLENGAAVTPARSRVAIHLPHFPASPLLFALLLLFACDPVVRREVTLTFDGPAENVTIAATTYVNAAKAGTPEFAQAEEARSALIAERDEWSVRFAQAMPQAERVTIERSAGKIDSVERRATVATDQLQKFFFDTPITVTTTRGEGWLEMTMYAGASTRATPAQRRKAEKILDAYAARALRYFAAVRTMYLYLDEHPHRAAALYTDIFSGEKDEERPPVSSNERGITDAVRDAGSALIDTDDIDAGTNLDRLFDLVYNPFPANFKVVVAGGILGFEGFERVSSDTFEIRMPTALEAVTQLEGRWVSPDPLAAMVRSESKSAAEMTAMMLATPRRTETIVTRDDVAAAIVERLRPLPRYRLRFTTKAQPPAS